MPLRFISLKSSSPLSTPNHPTVPPPTPEHPEHPYHPHFSIPKHSNLHQLPSPQRQHQHPESNDDIQSDILPILPPQAAEEPKLNTRTVLNPFSITLVLENRGSVARDHLALERTYLAYVRTSLAIASAGVALVQLFTISSKNTDVHFAAAGFARPLGAVMIIYALIVLSMGTFRYFRIQRTLPHGLFPTSLHGIAGLALILGAFITVLFGILVGVKS